MFFVKKSTNTALLSHKPVGVFDSGVGGLTVLKKLLTFFPHIPFIYVADTLHLPYGEKSSSWLKGRYTQLLDFFLKKECSSLVIACNTMSVSVLNEEESTIPVIGTIEPTIRFLPSFQRIGIMATQATVRSGVFEREIKKKYPNTEIFSMACPLLVPLIEASSFNQRAAEVALSSYLKPLMEKRIEALIYGCTHYPHLDFLIREKAPYVCLVDPADSIIKRLQMIEGERENGGIFDLSHAIPSFFVSKDSDLFSQKIQKFLGKSYFVDFFGT